MSCGGFNQAQAPTEEEVALFTQFESEIKQQADGELTVESVSTQVVNGVNYIFTAKNAAGQVFQVKIYKALPHAGGQAELKSVTAQ
jgi:hypothetical protein